MNELIKGLSEELTEGFDKIAEAYDIPSERQEAAKQALSDQVDYLCKEAGIFGDAAYGAMGAARKMGGLRSSNMSTNLGAGAAALGGTLAASAITGLASAAVNKIGKMYGASTKRDAYEKAYHQSLESSEILKNDPDKARRMADTIFSFAPTVAADPNVLTNILVNSIHGDSMDIQTVRMVTELEEKLNKLR